MSRYDHLPSGETKQEPYKPELRDFPTPKTQEFRKGINDEYTRRMEEAEQKIKADLAREDNERRCEDIVDEIWRIGRVLAEKGFGSRPEEDKRVVVTSYVGGESTNSCGVYVGYVPAVAARVILKGTYDDSGWQQAQEDLIYKGSDLGITNPDDETQYNKRGYVISIVTGRPVEVYSDRPLTEERKNSFHGPHQPGTVLVSFAGRYNDEAKVLRVGELGKSTNPEAYERVLAAMQDIEEELPASKETQ